MSTTSPPEAVWRRDTLAAFAVLALLVPQSMAYAMLAGVPPATGLACAAAAALAYAPLGSGRYLAVGPVALTCLLVAGGLQPLADVGTTRYLDLAIALSLMVAALFGLLAVVRAGFIANFLGQPAIVGFNAAGALLTAASQIRPFFGLPATATVGATAENPWPVLLHLGNTSVLALGVGLATLGIIVGLPRWNRRIPAALVACVAGGAAVGLFGLDDAGLATVTPVPAQWPSLRWPTISWSDVRALLPTAISVAIVSYGSSIAVAKALAAKEREQIEPNRELWALAAANLASAVVGSFPASAGLSRTLVMQQAGGRTRRAGALVGVGVIAIVAVAAPAFAMLPLAVLAGIVMHAAMGLFDVREARVILRTHRSDAATMIATFAITLGLGLVPGLAAGLIVALILFVHRTASPHTAELGRIPGSMVYRNTARFAVEVCPQVGILRVDAPLYFANARFLEDRVHQMLAERQDQRVVAIDCSGISDIDATAVQTLRNLALALRERGNDLHLIGPIGPVRDVLARTGMVELLGESNLHRSIVEGAPTLMARIDRTYCERRCTVCAFPDCSVQPADLVGACRDRVPSAAMPALAPDDPRREHRMLALSEVRLYCVHARPAPPRRRSLRPIDGPVHVLWGMAGRHQTGAA
jgi:sulfate permease, SulP family